MSQGGDKFMMGVVAGAIGLVLLCLCCIVAGVASPFAILFKSGAHAAGKAYLEKDPAVIAAVGDVKKVGQKLQGTMHESDGEGTAEFYYDVEGTRASGVAKVQLTKAKDQDWVVVHAELEVAGRVVVLKE